MKLTRDDVVFAVVVGWTVIATAITGGIYLSRRHAEAAARQPPKPKSVADWQRFAERGHTVGPNNRRVTLVVFSDFQCPFCRKFSTTLDSLRELYPEVRLVERNYPLSEIHESAFEAALAAECATDVGKYEPTRRIMFQMQGLVTDAQWGMIASKAGIRDTVAFVQCIATQQHADVVRADLAAGKQVGVQATPSVLINDTLFTGALSLSDLSRRVAKLDAAAK